MFVHIRLRTNTTESELRFLGGCPLNVGDVAPNWIILFCLSLITNLLCSSLSHFTLLFCFLFIVLYCRTHCPEHRVEHLPYENFKMQVIDSGGLDH